MFLDAAIPLVIDQPKLFCIREKGNYRQPTSNSSAKGDDRWNIEKNLVPTSTPQKTMIIQAICLTDVLILVYKIICPETSPFCSNLFVDPIYKLINASHQTQHPEQVLQGHMSCKNYRSFCFLGTNVYSPFPHHWLAYWLWPDCEAVSESRQESFPAEGWVSLWPLGGAVGKGERWIR